MITIYTACAIGGTVILLGQMALTLMGLDDAGDDIMEVGDDLEMGDEYIDTHNLATRFFGVFSFRSITAAIAFFGLGGRIGLAADVSAFFSFTIALICATLAMVVVAWIMRMLYQLHSEGNVDIHSCIGSVGTVYLPIPGERSGAGKVTVSVQDRTMEYQAVTSKEAIERGARVVITGITDTDTLEVEQETG